MYVQTEMKIRRNNHPNGKKIHWKKRRDICFTFCNVYARNMQFS